MTRITRFEHWAIVEMMGHRQLAGRVTEVQIAGAALLQIDVPAVGDQQAFTSFIGAGSIYSMTIVSEEIARAKADSLRPTPVSIYELRPLLREYAKRLLATDPAPVTAEVEDEEYDDQ